MQPLPGAGQDGEEEKKVGKGKRKEEAVGSEPRNLVESTSGV